MGGREIYAAQMDDMCILSTKLLQSAANVEETAYKLYRDYCLKWRSPDGSTEQQQLLSDMLEEFRLVLSHGQNCDEDAKMCLEAQIRAVLRVQKDLPTMNDPASDSAQDAMTNFEVTAEEIADKEIGLWKLCTVPLPKTDDPLMEWKLCGDKNVCPFLGRLARRVLAVPATSASPERLFSTAGNQMTKKRCGLTCDNLETLVYLHEVWPKTCEWEARKKLRVV